jgi:hypothetical protein
MQDARASSLLSLVFLILVFPHLLVAQCVVPGALDCVRGLGRTACTAYPTPEVAVEDTLGTALALPNLVVEDGGGSAGLSDSSGRVLELSWTRDPASATLAFAGRQVRLGFDGSEGRWFPDSEVDWELVSIAPELLAFLVEVRPDLAKPRRIGWEPALLPFPPSTLHFRRFPVALPCSLAGVAQEHQPSFVVGPTTGADFELLMLDASRRPFRLEIGDVGTLTTPSGEVRVFQQLTEVPEIPPPSGSSPFFSSGAREVLALEREEIDLVIGVSGLIRSWTPTAAEPGEPELRNTYGAVNPGRYRCPNGCPLPIWNEIDCSGAWSESFRVFLMPTEGQALQALVAIENEWCFNTGTDGINTCCDYNNGAGCVMGVCSASGQGKIGFYVNDCDGRDVKHSNTNPITAACCLTYCPDETPLPDGPIDDPDDANSDPGCRYFCTPIVVDIGGGGYRFTGFDQSVEFDLDGDGHRERLTWTEPKSDEAFLAMDRDGDGRIEDGYELFGGVTLQEASEDPNGFRALCWFDDPRQGGNGDDWISSADLVFSSLLVWRDRNHDGISQASELVSLGQAGVEALSCQTVVSRRRDRYGNELHWQSLVRFASGQQRLAAGDVILQIVP